MNRCRSTRSTIVRAFAHERLGPERTRALQEHLRECDGCRARFDALALAARAAGAPHRAALSAWELALMESRVLASVAPARSSRRRGGRVVLGLAMAGALAATVVLAPRSPRRADDGWRARGGGGEALAVRMLCETTDVSGATLVRSWVPVAGPQEIDACPAGARVRAAYMASKAGFLYVATSSDGGPLRWARAPVAVDAVEKLTLLPVDLTEQTRTARDTLEVVVVLAPRPLSPEVVEAAARSTAPGPYTTNRQVLRMAPGHRGR